MVHVECWHPSAPKSHLCLTVKISFGLRSGQEREHANDNCGVYFIVIICCSLYQVIYLHVCIFCQGLLILVLSEAACYICRCSIIVDLAFLDGLKYFVRVCRVFHLVSTLVMSKQFFFTILVINCETCYKVKLLPKKIYYRNFGHMFCPGSDDFRFLVVFQQ